MKSMTLPCTCGMRDCHTKFILEEDTEKPNNIILRIIDEKHEYGCFVSLGKEELAQLFGRIRTKYKGI